MEIFIWTKKQIIQYSQPQLENLIPTYTHSLSVLVIHSVTHVHVSTYMHCPWYRLNNFMEFNMHHMYMYVCSLDVSVFASYLNVMFSKASLLDSMTLDIRHSASSYPYRLDDLI